MGRQRRSPSHIHTPHTIPLSKRPGEASQHHRGKRTHILESLFGAPPVTFATRSAPSSCFNSFNCSNPSDGFQVPRNAIMP